MICPKRSRINIKSHFVFIYTEKRTITFITHNQELTQLRFGVEIPPEIIKHIARVSSILGKQDKGEKIESCRVEGKARPI